MVAGGGGGWWWGDAVVKVGGWDDVCLLRRNMFIC
jgi:hypothetical protein